jgi:eukaryotic-like serine/threonine-protein kinase
MGELFAGRYELVDPIGHGSGGAIWRAWDHRRRTYIAAKVLRQSAAHTLIRFVREQALRIDHPHVLAPRSWAVDDERVLFAMELVRGGSLAHLIADYGELPPTYVCTLLDQLLSGLSAVHKERIVHRNVESANILLEGTGIGCPHVRLSGFGIAMRKGEPRRTQVNHGAGTLGCFAPEQLMGAEPDFSADLYATGTVALHLLTGRRPSDVLAERFIRHGLPGIPEPLWEVVATLLQPSPEARFRTATDAHKALARAAELLPESAFDDELIEVFDHLGPLPGGFGPRGPLGDGAKWPRRQPYLESASNLGKTVWITDVASSREPETGDATPQSQIPGDDPPEAMDITAEDETAVAGPAAETLEHTLARLFVRLGSPPEPSELDYTPAGTGDGGAQQ